MSENEQMAYATYESGKIISPEREGTFPLIEKATGKRIGRAAVRMIDLDGEMLYQASITWEGQKNNRCPITGTHY
jgi:hypothetical protein